MFRVPASPAVGALRGSMLAAGACKTTLGTSNYNALFCSQRFVRTPEGIYKSDFPSVMESINKEQSLYAYMMKRWKLADQDRKACIQAETGQSFTYGELPALTEKFAQILYHKGEVRKDDVVCIAMLNTVLYAPVAYGCMRLGGVISTMNAVAAPSTLAYHLKANNTKVLLTMKFFQKNMEEAVDIVFKETGHKVTILYPDQFTAMSDTPAIPADYDPISEVKADDPVFIPFSSGSTGLPKGVQLTNKCLIANMEQVRTCFDLVNDDISISVLPFFHIFGFTCCLNALMTCQGTQVVMMRYTLDTFLQVIQDQKVTLSLVAPPILVSLLKNAEKVKKYDTSTIKAMRSGSAPLTAEMEQACEELFPGCSVGQGYGMTEMSPVVTAVPMNDKNRKYGSSGKIIPDTEMRIVKIDDNQQSGADRSAGVDVEEGGTGELWFRGPQIMKGYLKEEDTKMAVQNGWFRTGDIGYYDKKTGDLMITDRLKELIKYKGFQVSPAEMEGVLLEHSWVEDCLVIGVPDPLDISFENPRALVVLKKTLGKSDTVRASDEIYRYIQGKMPPHKRLHGGVRIVDKLERNPTGKVMRRQIRQKEIDFLKAEADGTVVEDSGSHFAERMQSFRELKEKIVLLVKLTWHIQAGKWKNKMN